MRWEELTGDHFPRVVEQVGGVCLLPFSCIERHGHHLPLGTDMFIGRELCRRTAALEPVVIYPDFFYTQILEARHMPGTIGIEPEPCYSEIPARDRPWAEENRHRQCAWRNDHLSISSPRFIGQPAIMFLCTPPFLCG
jgi:hypothetical protein